MIWPGIIIAGFFISYMSFCAGIFFAEGRIRQQELLQQGAGSVDLQISFKNGDRLTSNGKVRITQMQTLDGAISDIELNHN